MLAQILQNSAKVFRQPTVKSFREVNVDNWPWALYYLAIGAVFAGVIILVSYLIQAPAREKQLSEAAQRLSSSNFSFLHVLQNPIFTLTICVVGFFFVNLLWILLPYWMGRALGGSKSFGKFAYNNSLFLTPITILSALLASISSSIGGAYALLSISLEAFCFYLVYINHQATSGLSKRKSVFVIAFPIGLYIIPFCGFIAFFSYATFTR